MTRDVIATTGAPAAIGPYSQAVKANGFLFTAGFGPQDPATGQVVEGGVRLRQFARRDEAAELRGGRQA